MQVDFNLCLRCLFDDPLQVDAVVGGRQRVGAVQKVDLELARPELRRRRIRRQSLAA